MDLLLELANSRKIFIIEDCAQAHGAEWNSKKVGSFGDIGCFSFYPTKNLGAIGDGGAVVTNNPIIADRVRSLRQYGWDGERISIEPSGVSRLDEIQAAILRVKLPFLDRQNEIRRRIAGVYRERLSKSNITTPGEKFGARHVYHLFVVRVENRERVIQNLNSKEIYPGIHYSLPVHLHPGFKRFVVQESGNLAVTEKLSTEILSLPMFPELNDDEIDRVCEGMLNV
jgi:dTDP-4-amino-4,6-dideoxygalactose transaminase